MSAYNTLTLDQITTAILSAGHKRTTLVQGHMGTGKSSLLTAIAAAKPTHTPCYFDCTTKDLGDITLPMITGAAGDTATHVRYATNEELGAHHDAPIILMIDEYGKANPAVKNALLRLMLERKIGSYSLHPESIIFATTNLGAEGVGDLLPPHARNRITVLTAAKPTHTQWIEWGLANGINHTLLGWCNETPQLFQGFEDVPNPNDNPYIYHPAEQRAAFVTPRSLEAASDWIKSGLDHDTLTACLIGTIGERAALDLMAFVRMAGKLPKMQEIKDDPMNAPVPDGAAAVCMVVFRTLGAIDATWVDQWMTYLGRLGKEAQAMFAGGVMSPKYPAKKQAVVMTNKQFTQWTMQNGYMFAADKK